MCVGPRGEMEVRRNALNTAVELIRRTFIGEFAAEITFFLFKIAESMLEPTVRLFIYEAVCLNEFPPRGHRHWHYRLHHGDGLATSSGGGGGGGHDSTCTHLHHHPDRELIVQNTAAHYMIYYKLLLNFPSMLLVLLCGAWSDRAGRKLPIILTCFGTTTAVVLYMLSIYVGGLMSGGDGRGDVGHGGVVPFLPLLLLGAAVRGSFGRSAVMTMAVHSYVSDHSAPDGRTQKLSNLVAMSHFGYLVGSLCAGLLLDHYGFLRVFLTVAGIQTTCVLTASLSMKDEPAPSTSDVDENANDEVDSNKSVEVDERTHLLSSPIKNGNNLQANGNLSSSADEPASSPAQADKSCCGYLRRLSDSFRMLFRRRPGNGRCRLLALFFAISLQQAMKSGEADVLLLYVERTPLNMTKSMYGYLLAANYACLGLCAFVVPRLLQRTCRLSDGFLALIGLSFRLAGLAVLSFADSIPLVFLAVSLAGPHSMTVCSAKSLISKTVSEGEMGRTFSLLSSGETLSNLVGTVIFANLYAATLTLFPGTAFIVEAGVFVVIFSIVVHVTCGQLRSQRDDGRITTPVYTSP